MSKSITLYSNAGCPFAQRARIVLLEKSLDFAYVEVDLSDRPRWFADVSPTGKVPVLVDGDLRLYESAIINEYLDECYPEPLLMPVGAARRAEARLWIHRSNSEFAQDMFWAAVAPDPAKIALHVEALQRALAEIESTVFADGRHWWFGDALSLVDISYYTSCERLAAVRGDLTLSDYPYTEDWIQRMQNRDSVAATALTDQQHIANFSTLAQRLQRRG